MTVLNRLLALFRGHKREAARPSPAQASRPGPRATPTAPATRTGRDSRPARPDRAESPDFDVATSILGLLDTGGSTPGSTTESAKAAPACEPATSHHPVHHAPVHHDTVHHAPAQACEVAAPQMDYSSPTVSGGD